MNFGEVLYCLVTFCLACTIPSIDEANLRKWSTPSDKNLDFFMNGTIIFGGLFPLHYALQNISLSPQCPGKFNIRGFEEALAMIYAVEKINNNSAILPGIRLGADIKDTCSSADFAIRKSLNFSFVRRNLEDFPCTTSRIKAENSRTVAIVGIRTSDVAMAVTNLVGLFQVPVLSYASSSRLLSDRVRFKYFLRTISSDSLMARVIVDFLRKLQWNIVHIWYSDTDYGRSAVESLEHVLTSSAGIKICVAVKKHFTKHTDVKEIQDVLTQMKTKENAKAKAVLLFATIEDAEFIVNLFHRFSMREYVFIATDHFNGPIDRFQISPDMLRRIVGVMPRTGHSQRFTEYFEYLKQSGLRFPWLNEYGGQFWKSEQYSTYVPFVIDAVYAAAYGLNSLLDCTPNLGCKRSPNEFSTLNRQDGGLLARIQRVRFKGVSRDPVSFDFNGNSLGAYDITVVNMETREWQPIGSWTSNTSDLMDIPANVSFLDLNVTRLKMIWKEVFGNDTEPSSLCGQQCPPGYWMRAEDHHQSCCWQCTLCMKNEISHNPVNGSCQRCPPRYWTNTNHTTCVPIRPVAVKLRDPAGISIGVVAMLGAMIVVFIAIVIFVHGESHIFKASSKLLSYVMLLGILTSYVTAAMILTERTEMLCRVVFFGFSIGFSMVVGTLLAKTNRIHHTFSRRTAKKGTPQCLSGKWMAVFVGCSVAAEVSICVIIVVRTPGRKLREVVYSDAKNEASVQCNLCTSQPGFDTALWWCFNSALVLICTYQAYLIRKVPGNLNEARFIVFNMVTISTDVLVFFLSYYGTDTYYKDILVSSFLIVAATVTISCIFLPQVYAILFKTEKSVVGRSSVALGDVYCEEDAKKTSVIGSLYKSSNSRVAVDGRLNEGGDDTHHRNGGKTGIHATTPTLQENDSGELSQESSQRSGITPSHSNSSVRNVRFKDDS